MNSNNKLFSLPGDILSHIYKYDSTYSAIFATELSKIEIKIMSHKIKQTEKNIINFIKSRLVSIPGFIDKSPIWSYISHNPFFWIPDEKLIFGSELKIFMHPKEERYTKYQVLEIESIIDIKLFDGYVCNEEQHFDIMSTKELQLFEFDSLSIYKLDEYWISINYIDTEIGLYLHTVYSFAKDYIDNYENF
jgi:hypothetical protein